MRMTAQGWGFLLLLGPLGRWLLLCRRGARQLSAAHPWPCGPAFLVLVVVVKFSDEPLPAPNAIPAFAAMGLLNNLLPFTLLFWAQTTIPSGLASILNATTPMFSMFVAHFLLADERMATNKVLGDVLGLAGVAVLLGADLLDGFGTAALGMVACLGAALSYGFAGVYGRRFRTRGVSARQVALGQLSATTAMMLPIVMVVDAPWTLPVPGPAAMSSMLALAILSTALAYVIFFRLFASAGAVNVALVTLLIPVTAVVLGTLVLGETLTRRNCLGMALVGVGLVAIDGRVLGRLRDRGSGGTSG